MFIINYFYLMFYMILMTLFSIVLLITDFAIEGLIYPFIGVTIAFIQGFNVYLFGKYILKLMRREKLSIRQIILFILTIIIFIVLGHIGSLSVEYLSIV